MRLKKLQAVDATNELLGILAEHPEGLRTSEISGTSRFHGERTLKAPQIIRLLRASGRAKEFPGGQGKRTFLVWTLADMIAAPGEESAQASQQEKKRQLVRNDRAEKRTAQVCERCIANS